MTIQTTKIKNGTIILPKPFRETWKEGKVLIYPQKDKLIIEKQQKPSKDNYYKLWKKAAGILKEKKIPHPVKWQRKIRQEWERSIL